MSNFVLFFHIFIILLFVSKCPGPFDIGIKWHPELMLEYDHVMKKLFDSFIETTVQKSNKEEKIKVLNF